MNTVTKINPHHLTTQCPAELRTLPAWLMWRLEYHEGEDKPRKVPFYASGARRHGKQGTAQDRQQLVTFDAARAAAARRNMDGVGIALMPEWGLTALDFDNCVLASGELHPDVSAIACQSYAEWSPSGRGVRVLFKGNLLNRKSFDGEFGFETFSTSGFVTFTGNRLDVTDLLGNADVVAEVTPEVMGLFSKRFGQRVDREATGHNDEILSLTPTEIEAALTAMDPDMGHDDWLHAGMALHHETRGEGFDLWNDWSERGGKYPGRDVLRHRWDSFGRYDGPAVTGRTLVKLAGDAGVPIGPAAPASADEFDIVEPEPGAKPRGQKYVFEPASSFASVEGLPWLVDDVLPQHGLAVVYGASGSGKTFGVLDLMMAVARGVPWRERYVEQAAVAYVVAEGSGGFRKRLSAYAQHHEADLNGLPFWVLNAAPNLLDKGDTKELITGLQALGKVGVVVVDTLAQTTAGGNENAGEDMGKALGHCKRIQEATGGLVLLVHHSGKDQAKGARGWSGLRAAVDAEIEVVRLETGGRYLRLTKAKDGEDNLEWGFDLDVVHLGHDARGKAITSCVVRTAEVPKATLTRKLGPVEVVVNDVIQEFAKAQTEGIEVEAVLAETVRRLPEAESGKRDTRRQRARRALENLSAGDSAPYWVGNDGCLSVL